MKKIIVAIVAVAMLLFAPIAKPIEQYQTKEGQNVFVWTEQEMDVIERALSKLTAENREMKAKIAKYEASCI